MGKLHAIDVKFSQDFTQQKSLKSVNIWQSYFKYKKVDVFWDTVYLKLETYYHTVELKVDAAAAAAKLIGAPPPPTSKTRRAAADKIGSAQISTHAVWNFSSGAATPLKF